MKHSFFILSILMLLNTGTVSGQNLTAVPDSSSSLPDPGKYPVSLYITLSLGPSSWLGTTGHRNMNKLLEKQGFSNPSPLIVYHFGFGVRLKRLLMEIQSTQSLQPFGESDKRLSTEPGYLSIGYGMGYALLQRRNSSFYLMSGVDMVGYSLKARQITYSPDPIDVTQLEAGHAFRTWPSFTHTGATGSVGLKWVQGREKRPFNMGTELHIGYQFGLGTPRWETEQYPLLNAPTDRAGFVYMKCNVSLSRNFEKKTKKGER